MRKGLRIALVVLALNCICFFRGCDGKQGWVMSFGFPAPIVTVQYDGASVSTPGSQVEVLVPTKIVSWSAWTPVADVLFILVLAAWLWLRGGITPIPWRCFWLAATILNSHLIPLVGDWLWFYCVLEPTAWVLEPINAALFSGLPSDIVRASDENGLAVDIASRLYFVLLFAACWGLAALGGWGYRRFRPARSDAGEAEVGSPGEALRSDAPSPMASG